MIIIIYNQKEKVWHKTRINRIGEYVTFFSQFIHFYLYSFGYILTEYSFTYRLIETKIHFSLFKEEIVV